MTLSEMKKLKREDKKKVLNTFKNINVFNLKDTKGHDGSCQNVLVLIEEEGNTFLFTMSQDPWTYDLIRTSVVYKVEGMLQQKRKTTVLKLFNTCVNDNTNIDNNFLENFEKTISKKIVLNVSMGRPTTFDELISTIV